MRPKRLVVSMPGLITAEGQESLLREFSGPLWKLVDTGQVSIVEPEPPYDVPELSLLGLDPSRFRIAQGPLTVSALGFDPPERSVHFHVSVGSLDREGAIQRLTRTDTEDWSRALVACKKLDTRTLTLLPCDDRNLGLVWEEGSLDTALVPFEEAIGRPFVSCLPEGDGEVILRRFVDDSVNILEAMDFNKRRLDEGLEPLNLLWPWGAGIREHLPNLAFRRGEPVQYESRDLRLSGLVRLFGYRHGDRREFGRPLAPDLARLADLTARYPVLVVLLQHLGEAVTKGRIDEAVQMLEEMADQWLLPASRMRPFQLVLLAPQAAGRGLALTWDSEAPLVGAKPFDERILDDRTIPVHHAWELVASVLS